jgi:hypothetical protein
VQAEDAGEGHPPAEYLAEDETRPADVDELRPRREQDQRDRQGEDAEGDEQAAGDLLKRPARARREAHHFEFGRLAGRARRAAEAAEARVAGVLRPAVAADAGGGRRGGQRDDGVGLAFERLTVAVEHAAAVRDGEVEGGDGGRGAARAQRDREAAGVVEEVGEHDVLARGAAGLQGVLADDLVVEPFERGDEPGARALDVAGQHAPRHVLADRVFVL